MAWLSPAFPTGGFAYSHGLEWAVEAGDVTDAASLRAWVEDVLRHGAGRSDAILLRHAYAGEDVIELARSAQPCRERLGEAAAQGAAFVRAAAAWQGNTVMLGLDPSIGRHTPDARVKPEHDGPAREPTYALAVGELAGQHGIEVDMTCAAYLQAFAANLISAAVRLVPLGQSTGLAVLAALEPAILEIAAATRGAPLDDIGGCAFRSDIAAMRHETQYTRLFRS